MPRPSIFKSEQGRRAILAWYDAQVQKLPVAIESRMIDTFAGLSFGGWILLNLAALAPTRIVSAMFLDSGGFTQFTWKARDIFLTNMRPNK